ncbi:MAG: GNAT family N-acetyltransferase [Prevotella sp.]
MQTDVFSIRQARPDEASVVARLIMTAMTDECCLFFCGEENGIDDFHRVMTGLVERDDTQYSYANTLCAVNDEDKIVGICTSYDGARLRELRQTFLDVAMKEWGKDHSGMPEETQAGELYIDSLAVDSSYRGKGIATMLINATSDKARKMDIPLTGLLVDTGNPRAEALYTRVGFKLAGTNSWGGHGMKHFVLHN